MTDQICATLQAREDSETPSAPPVGLCSWIENPHRLVSLWDLVNQFNLFEFANLYGLLECLLTSAHATTSDTVETTAFVNVCRGIARFCTEYGYDTCRDMANLAAYRMGQTATVVPIVIETEARNLELLFSREIHERRFLWIAKDKSGFIDNENLFGQKVVDAFPSAARDIKEAGNCLVAGSGTAAVFHLMRAAEIPLRALAADRGVAYPDAALSSKQVGDLLAALDGKMADMRRAAANLWPSKDVKDAQIKFYHAAIAELRDFNEAWRRHMAHAHDGAFYDPDYAESILRHVRSFMQSLCDKISETAATPLYWTSP